MSCNICAKNPVIGKRYVIYAKECKCLNCKSILPDVNPPTTYEGISNNIHMFKRIEKKVCEVCSHKLEYIFISCSEDLINVTDEFSQINAPQGVKRA